jgi:DNA-binding MarR family transcriptional regulator
MSSTSDSHRVGPPLVGAMLRLPWEAVRARMLAGLHARGYRDLVAAHLNVLQYPGPHGLSPSELASQLRMSKQATNYLLGQMEQLGYLERRPESGDARRKRIWLSPRGQRAGRAIREIVSEVEAEWEHELGADHFAQFMTLLRELNAVVDRRRTSATTRGVP